VVIEKSKEIMSSFSIRPSGDLPRKHMIFVITHHHSTEGRILKQFQCLSFTIKLKMQSQGAHPFNSQSSNLVKKIETDGVDHDYFALLISG
jgi:hypothetical protein